MGWTRRPTATVALVAALLIPLAPTGAATAIVEPPVEVVVLRIDASGSGSEGPEVESCGGISPVTVACARSWQVASSFEAFIVVQAGFTGTVVHRGSTATGSYNIQCTFTGSGLPFGTRECGGASSGVFQVGQTLGFDGRTFLLSAGLVQAWPTGVWSVGVRAT